MPETHAKPAHRIAFVTGSVGIGGATTFLCNLAGELARRGVPVTVASFEHDQPLAADFKSRNVPVFCLDERRRILEDRLTAILGHLKKFRPTVVLANLGPVSFEVLRYLPRGVFRVGVAHSDEPGVYRTMRCYAGEMDLLAVVSRKIEESVAAMPEFSSLTVKCLPLGVPMPGEIEPEKRNFSGPLRILYLGRLGQEQKRVRLFPEIFNQIKAAGIPFHWTIAGDGPEFGYLKSVMQDGSPTQTVSLLGGIKYSEVPRVLAQHDIFLLASDYEGLPLSLLEAMGSGLVPVVSDLPSGIREVVDKTNGKRIAPENTKGYAEAILWLHGHREEMRRLAEAARARVLREYSVAAMTDRWLGAFPPLPSTISEWPNSWSIKPPLAAATTWQFSAPARALRRLRLRWRAFAARKPAS